MLNKSSDRNKFTEDDKSVLEIVSHQIGVALESQQKEEALHAKTEEAKKEIAKSRATLDKLHEQLAAAEHKTRMARSESESAERSKAVLIDLFGTFELEPLMHQAMHSACQLVGAERGTVFVVDDDADEVWVLVQEGRDSGKNDHSRQSIDKGIPGFVAKSGECVMLKDAYMDPRFDPAIDSVLVTARAACYVFLHATLQAKSSA